MDSGQSGILGHHAQSRVEEGHSSERDTATTHLPKMAAPGVSANHQRFNRATHGIVQVLLSFGWFGFKADRGTLSTPSYHIISYRIVSYRIVSCRIVSCRVVSCRVVSCRVVSYRIVSYRIVSSRVVSCRVVSCRVVSCRVVS